jgi:hypothetical protein
MSQEPITVKRGEIYKVPGVGRIKVLGVRRAVTPPRMTYKRLRRRGVAVRWLSWREGAWRLPAGWERL